MEKFTKDEKEIIEIILRVMFSDDEYDVDIEDYQPGMKIESLDKHKVCLMINQDSQFYEALKQHLDFNERMKYYGIIDKLGYSDCISWTTPTPPSSSIFMSTCCNDIRWHTRGCYAIDVNVNGIYVDFEEINKILLKIKQAENYFNFKIDKTKLFQKIKHYIDEGKYDVEDNDEYI